METLLGNSVGVFVGVTLCVMGFATFMTGQALAVTWKPVWHAVVYAVLLGFVDRFLAFSLFDGPLLSLPAYLIDTAVLTTIALLTYRLGQVRKMVAQYPWLYERAGIFAWREKSPAGPAVR